MQFFDRELPFLKSVFDPETMYAANKECFVAAVEYAQSVTRKIPVLPFTSPVHHVRRNKIFDPSYFLGSTGGSSGKATPTDVSPEMFKHSTVQPMKDAGCDGLVLYDNFAGMMVAARGNVGQTGFPEEMIGLSRQYFANLAIGDGVANWSDSHIATQMRLSSSNTLVRVMTDTFDSIALKEGQSCCPPPQPPCADCKCRNSDPTDPRPLCDDIGLFDQCCSLADRCFNANINCGGGGVGGGNNCGCAGGSCRYSPGSPGGGGCPPDFVPVSACETPLCAYCFLRPWVVMGLDPLTTGQYGSMNTTGTIP
jgi:hypothetical protein